MYLAIPRILGGDLAPLATPLTLSVLCHALSRDTTSGAYPESRGASRLIPHPVHARIENRIPVEERPLDGHELDEDEAAVEMGSEHEERHVHHQHHAIRHEVVLWKLCSEGIAALVNAKLPNVVHGRDTKCFEEL